MACLSGYNEDVFLGGEASRHSGTFRKDRIISKNSDILLEHENPGLIQISDIRSLPYLLLWVLPKCFDIISIC